MQTIHRSSLTLATATSGPFLGILLATLVATALPAQAMVCIRYGSEPFQALTSDAYCKASSEKPSWRNGRANMEDSCKGAAFESNIYYHQAPKEYGWGDANHPVQKALSFLTSRLSVGGAAYGLACYSSIGSADDAHGANYWHSAHAYFNQAALIAMTPRAVTPGTQKLPLDSSQFETFDVTFPTPASVEGRPVFSRKIEGPISALPENTLGNVCESRLVATLKTTYIDSGPETRELLLCEVVSAGSLPGRTR